MTDGLGSQPPIMHNRIVNPNATSDEIWGGMLLVEDQSQTGFQRENVMTRASVATLMDSYPRVFAVKSGNVGVTGSGYDLDVVPLDDRGIEWIKVRTDNNVAAGDVLGVFPGTYFARIGATFGGPILRALEAVDGTSATAGANGALVQCELLHGQWAIDYWKEKSQVHTDTRFGAIGIAADPVNIAEGIAGIGTTGYDSADVGGQKSSLNTVATDAKEAYFHTGLLTPVAGTPYMGYAVIDYTPSSGTLGNIWCGFADAHTATDPMSNTDDFLATWSGAAFLKQAATTDWVVEASKESVQDTGATALTHVDGQKNHFLVYTDGFDFYFYYKELDAGTWTLLHTADAGTTVWPTNAQYFQIGVMASSASTAQLMGVFRMRCIAPA